MNDRDTNDRYPDGEEGRDQWYEDARNRVRTPGTLLMVFGLLSLFLAALSLGIYALNPEIAVKPLYDFQVDLQKNQPAEQRQQLPPFEEYVKQQQVQSLATSALSLICSIPIVLGGIKMKSLTGYGWAMAASVLSMIPCTNSCCCLGLPFGIWALVVLLNGDVKLAFAKSASSDLQGDRE